MLGILYNYKRMLLYVMYRLSLLFEPKDPLTNYGFGAGGSGGWHRSTDIVHSVWGV